MSNKSKIKGDTFERSIVHEAEALGLKAYRNRMSRAPECDDSWDVCIAGRRFEAKKRAAGFKQIEKWLQPGIDGVICGANHREPFVVLRLEELLKLL